ncbi:hypothetical protein [Luteimonas sp. MC1828]|uniref:hypothetical protein n=1 Tax=Luteimonas sp. MC1828 TaxID=2799787 RepID=UPI0018F1AE26|nr:hypothetical protein [Luteimonas sp. MC1828]MBJ7576257.1 hypothetical protein [Luteimonas sp. MC1828]
MDVTSLAIVALMTAAALAAVALPVWVAWFLAHRAHLPARRLFVVTCTLLAFGFLTLAGAVLLPIEIAATWVAPELHTAGYPMVANMIFLASEHGVPVICFAVGVFASFVVPLRLRRIWPSVVSAIGANNSFKPTPLRGAA